MSMNYKSLAVKRAGLLVLTLAAVMAVPTTTLAQTVTFASFGDFGDDSAAEASVAALVPTLNPDFIVTTGDNSYTVGGGTPAWDANVGDHYGGYIRYPAGSTSTHAPGVATNAFFTAMGNHDWDAGTNEYTDYFDLPGTGIATSGTSGNERYYDFVQGPVHFFVVSSDNREPDGNTSGSTQGAWLQAQLAASTSPWKLVYMHHPPFSSSSNHGNTPNLQWPYEAWGADAVFAGHDHTYERILRDANTDGVDMPYFVTGLGGRSLYGFGTPEPGSVVRYNADYGSMLITANSASITFEFYEATGGTVIDTYTMTNGNLVCEAFDSFTTGQPVGNDANWFDGGSGPDVNATDGVNGSQGLDASGTIFTWTGEPIDWNSASTLGVTVQLDLETDGSGNLDDDRVGWMITDVSTGSDNIFGVQADPGGSGPGPINLEAYWDGDSFGDDGGRTSIASLPNLSANTFYRLRADITKLTATSVRVDAVLIELDGSGNEVGVVGSGSIPDTDLLPNTAGNEIPNPGYFSAATIWPAYKNHTSSGANADNACYAVLTSTTPPGPGPAAGDVIIAGLQPSGSAEMIELFNTTDQPISLAGLTIVTRVGDGASVVDDWTFGPNLTGEFIQPHSFYLIAEAGVAAENGNQDHTATLDLATGEGGTTGTAIGVDLSIGGVHMDHVLYGRADGSNSVPVAPGDIAFGGSYPRTEVIWNTNGTGNFSEGTLQRIGSANLFAGHAVEGFYTDEAALPGSNPVGVWTSPHDGGAGVPARNSTSAAVAPAAAAGDLIISGLQPSGSGEYIEIFNTTSHQISLEGLEIVARVSVANSLVDDWTFTPNLTGEVIEPYSFYLFAENAADGEGGTTDYLGALDLATGEGGVGETAIGVQLSLGGTHMDHVLYGYSLGTNSTPVPDGDIAFAGSYPRVEVIWNTLGGGSFAEGALQRISMADLHAGHAVNGFYTDEGALGSGNPTGVWTSPHDGGDGVLARNSGSAAVMPPADPEITVTESLTAFASAPGVPSAEQSYTVEAVGLTEDITVTAPADFGVSLASGGPYLSSVMVTQTGGMVSSTDVYVSFNRATAGASGGDIAHTSAGAPTQNVAVSGLAQVPLNPGDVIIAGVQSWNSPGADDPGEFIELFNTTGNTIFLDNMEIISRTDNEPNGSLDIDWQLADEGVNLAGLSIAPYSFFLIAESDVDAVGAGTGVHDLETNMDLATGEGGATERAIGIQLLIDGQHMDHVLYGRSDGSDTAAIPDGDIAFGGTYPRNEVVRNTTGDGSFQEGYFYRDSQADLHAGHAVNGFYKDEGALAGSNPVGVWTSSHDEEDDSYEARNSTSAAVNPPAPIPPDDPAGLSASPASHTAINLAWTDASTNEDNFEVHRADSPGGTYTLLVTLPAGSQAHTDSPVASNEDYCYKVLATNIYGDSGFTSEECATTPAAPARVIDDLLVLYDFEEGTGTTINDVSGVGTPLNLAVTSGAPTWDVPGALNVSSASVIGSAAAATKVISGVQATGAISVEAWIKPANTTQFGPARVVALSGGATVGHDFVVGPGPGSADMTKYSARFRTTSTNVFGSNPTLTTANGQVTTNLTHVVFTRNGAGATVMYINGVSVATGFTGGALSNWGNYILTLANEPTADRAWLGEFHLVAIYGQALSAADVAQNYTAGPDGVAPVPTYALTTNVVGNGSIAKSPNQAQYDENTVVQVTATPAAGWVFTGWSGAITGTVNPQNVTMDANKSVTATFVELSTELAGSLTVSEVSTSSMQVLEFSTATGATDGTDAVIDVVLPPPPPSSFDARLVCGAGNTLCTDDLSTDVRAPIEDGETIIWVLNFTRETSSNDIDLDWTGSSFPAAGTVTLVDPLGVLADVDMMAQSTYTVTNDGISTLHIVYELNGGATSFDKSIVEGWNMVGLPLNVDDNDVTVVYPTSTGGTLYSFNPVAGYELGTTLDLATGYWLQFAAAGVQAVNGMSVNGVGVSLPAAGWHMIAGPSCSIPAGSIGDPSGVVIPNTLYGFNGSNYVAAPSVDQGEGYWIKSTGAGQLVMTCTSIAAKTSTVAAVETDDELQGFGALAVRDQSGAVQELYFGSQLTEPGRLASYGVPPIPPKGAFDARFAGDNRLTQDEHGTILVQSSQYPVYVHLLRTPNATDEGFVVEELVDGLVAATHDVGSGGTITVTDPSVGELRLRKAASAQGVGEIPDEFALHGSYPNPFNTIATIRMDVPEAAEVEVVLIDVLGRVVQTLPTVTVSAGSQQSIQVSGASLAAGTYFYRVRAEMASATVVKTGRMTLTK